ncbi:MFS transporter [Ktedonobacter racemifer]|uniref:Major facilitator superfamily MFS_1 n=1 Tax=Ktedonobacter racemifer DSM 44963 TaxID=485913 RepID=D6U708_KTERA|nr:MFS transporter [Ktedonobacter racemifer]EFH79669.1 major facilitator superfamily MFS_1 [Ktedonobacter racemifer DSM 44963]
MEKTNDTLKKTPFQRLVAAMVVGEIGGSIGIYAATTLLLSLKFLQINPNTAEAHFGITSGLGVLAALIANPIGGAISDRTTLKFGRRRTWILLGTVLQGFSLLGLALTSDLTMIIVLWCLTQIFFNFVLASLTGLVPDQVEASRQGTISGIAGFALPLSALLGLSLMTMLNNAPMLLKWGVLPAIGIVAAVVSCILIIEGRVKFERKQKEKLKFTEALSRVYPSPRKYPVFTWGWLTRFFVSIAYSATVYNTIMLVKRFQYSQAEISSKVTLLSMISVFCLMVASIFGGMLSDKLRKQKPFVAISALVVGIGLVLCAIASDLTLVIVGNALIGLGYGIFTAVDLALVARILPNKEDAAKDFGIMNIANALPSSITPFIAPLLLAVGGWPFFFGALAVGGLVSALCVIPIPEVSPKVEDIKTETVANVQANM